MRVCPFPIAAGLSVTITDSHDSQLALYAESCERLPAFPRMNDGSSSYLSLCKLCRGRHEETSAAVTEDGDEVVIVER